MVTIVIFDGHSENLDAVVWVQLYSSWGYDVVYDGDSDLFYAVK